jgi:hypothetical protein
VVSPLKSTALKLPFLAHSNVCMSCTHLLALQSTWFCRWLYMYCALQVEPLNSAIAALVLPALNTLLTHAVRTGKPLCGDWASLYEVGNSACQSLLFLSESVFHTQPVDSHESAGARIVP